MDIATICAAGLAIAAVVGLLQDSTPFGDDALHYIGETRALTANFPFLAWDPTAFADSSFSRQLSRNYKIRPCLDMMIFVSGRRTKMGIAAFNRYHLAMIMSVVFKFFRASRWLRAENEYRIALHTRSKHRKRDSPKN
ncbi:hypothetical protein AUI07_09540 [archaeon 13_2_20CM_2_53_6]|nr:MAG: hypothetical protein AUI07_09540 [archaeon 13_2_20CM_2_53_6]